VYSDVLIEKGISDKINNVKVAIMQKISGMFGSIFGPIIAKATKEVARAIKIQLVFDLVIVVGLASIILMALKILKNQKVQHESLVITEAINFGSIAGTVAKIIGTTAGFIFLSAGLLYMTAFLWGYFQKDGTKTSIVGFTNIINGLRKLADNTLSKAEEKAKASAEDKRVKQLNDIKAKLDNLESIYEKVITEAAKQKKEYEKANAFVRFFKTFVAVAKLVGWKDGFDIIATPIVLVATPLKIELPVAFEKLKSMVTKNEDKNTEEEANDIKVKYLGKIWPDIIKAWRISAEVNALLKRNKNYKPMMYKGKAIKRLIDPSLIPDENKIVILAGVYDTVQKKIVMGTLFVGERVSRYLLDIFNDSDEVDISNVDTDKWDTSEYKKGE
jgi:hypothetical protein